MSKIFEVYIFTASNQYYAKSIIDFLDPEAKYISGILDRTKCLKTKNGFFIKDLRIIKNREMKNMIIVDNLAHSFGFQINNGVPILEWHDSFKDQELFYLKNYLTEAAEAEDVREFNRNRLKLDDMKNMMKEDLHI
jgi:CTD small phosphatase-like protein 2